MPSARYHSSPPCPTLTGKRCSGLTREQIDGPLHRDGPGFGMTLLLAGLSSILFFAFVAWLYFGAF